MDRTEKFCRVPGHSEGVDHSFIHQGDTPATYSGYEGQYVAVNTTGSGLQFSAHDYSRGRRSLTFSHSLTWNGPLDILGWYELTDGEAEISSGSPITSSAAFHNSHLILHVDGDGPVGAPFTITVSGTSISNNTGVITTSDSENLNIVTASGVRFYQTKKSWLSTPYLSIPEAGKSCIMDIYRSSYINRRNRPFMIRAISFDFEPDVPNWDIQLEVIHIFNDGTFHYIEHLEFAHTDTYPRAEVGCTGKHRRTDYAHTIDGSLNEGLIVRVDQTGVRHFFIAVTLDDL